jgi:hypothetical protein
MPNCGECLFTGVVIVELPADGICPRCGADYRDVLPPPVVPRQRHGEPDADEAELEDLNR